MNIADSELQRARWRRALDRHALDDTRRSDFALGGLATRLRHLTAQVLLLPGDPDAERLQVDDALWAWLSAQQSVAVDSWVVAFGAQTYPTAHAAALVSGYGSNEPWNSYLAVHRSGALELGLGDRGGWDRRTREGETVRGFNLISMIANTWALLTFNVALSERSSPSGPWQLTIGLRDTRNAVLGNLGEGWAEPGAFENRVAGCSEDNLLWHLELDELPDEDARRRLAFAIGDRIEDAWGVRQRRYLAHRGELAGRFDHRQIVD